GQTTRAGDALVAIESLPAEITNLVPRPLAAAARAPSTTRKPELRSTATDLTRGAVEVARGVWEGLKNPRAQELPRTFPPPIPAASAPSPATPRTSVVPPLIPPVPAGPPPEFAPRGDDVLSIQTLEEAAELSRIAREQVPLARESSAPAIAAGAGRAAGPAVSWSGTATAAVPVPPRSDRGVLGTLRATLALGLEVLMALISGPVKKSIGNVGRAGGEFVQSGRGWFVAALRLCLFLAGMLVLGAGLMYLLFLFLHS
ncbi:MAG TPA: hypothetical protein VM509_00785, partial [Planctomycetota bacterium]|nr:hypothetical protein [Planctomycetota bacterium]